jgi:hypothetical protein
MNATHPLQSTDPFEDDLPTDACRVGLELKFAVPEAKAHELVGCLATMLEPDPYAGPDGEYDVMSLYLDTPELDAYRRTVEHKWRVRRYGSSSRLFAELKARHGDCVVSPHPVAWTGRPDHRSTLVDDCSTRPSPVEGVGSGSPRT